MDNFKIKKLFSHHSQSESEDDLATPAQCSFMHPSKGYRSTSDNENLLFAERRGFGVWVINGNVTDDDSAPVTATAPFWTPSESKSEPEKGVCDENEKELPTVKAHLIER
jgi:hypothetical protein